MKPEVTDLRVARALSTPITSSRTWNGRFGAMVIETRGDGSVWIDGEVIADTLPPPGTEEASGVQDDAPPVPW